MKISDLVRKLQKDVRELSKLVLSARAGGGGGGGAHNLLSATHPDTTAAAVQRGDIITGQAAPAKWKRLAIGAADRILRSNGTDITWVQAESLFSHLDDGYIPYHVSDILGLADSNLFYDGSSLMILPGAGNLLLNTDIDSALGYLQIASLNPKTADASVIHLRSDEVLASNPLELRISQVGSATAALQAYLFQAGHYGLDFSANILLNSAGGNVGIGSAVPSEKLDVGGRFALLETTDPTLAANHGKIWVRSSDSKLYFMDDSGNIYELTASGTISAENFMPRPHLGRIWRGSMPYASSAGIGIGCAMTTGAGAQVNALAADGLWVQFRTTGLAGNTAIHRTATYDYCSPEINPHAHFLFKTGASIADVRIWIGFSTAQMPRNAVNNNNSIAMRFHTTVPDTNWMFCLTDNAGAQTAQDTGVAVAANTVYLMEIWTGDGGATWNWAINGTSGSNTNNVPLTTASWGLMLEIIAEAAAVKMLLHGCTWWLQDLG